MAAVTLAVIDPGLGDYSPHTAGNPDDAAPAIDAIIHGHLGRLPDLQPLMGLTSLVGRAPFAALGDAVGDSLDVYRFGAFACLWALAILALALARALRPASSLGALVAAALLMFNPATADAVKAGHPEELVLASTAVGGLLLTVRGRAATAGALTGMAIGTKPFGVLAVLPQAIVAGTRRTRTLTAALAVGIALALPLPLLSPQTYIDGSKALAKHERIYATSIWWPLGHNRDLAFSTGNGPETLRLRVMPAGFDRGTGTIAAVLFAFALSAVAALRRGVSLAHDGLALLAAIFFARAFFDPLNLEYYAVPGFAALVAWEALARRRPPILALAAIGGDVLTFHAGLGHTGLQATFYLLWVLPLTAYLVAISTRRT